MLKRTIAFVGLAFTLTSTLAGCSGGPTESSTPVAQVDVTGAPAENVLITGATAQLRAVTRDAGGGVLDRRVTWSSTDPAIASVSSTGLVTGVAAGIAVVTAVSGGETGAVALDVRVAVPVPPASATAPVTSSLLGNTLQLTLAPGATTTPSITVGRALIITNDTRILTATAFAIGPAAVNFTTPAAVELSVALAGIPTAKRAGLRLFRVSAGGDLEPVASSSVDVPRGVVIATLARGGAYVVLVPGDPTMLVDAEGNSRRVEVGTAVPGISVIARDAAGNPVPGALIEFSVEGATGSIVGDTIASTDLSGFAELPGEWIAGPAKGTYALRARLLGTALSVQFTATAFTPAVAVQIVSAPTVGSSGVNLPDPIIVQLVDAFGDRAEVNQQVTLSLIGGSGTLAGTTTDLAVFGGVIFQGQRIDGGGTYRIVASSAGLAPDTTAAIVVTQQVAWLQVLTQPAGAVSGVPFTTQPVVELRDNAGLRVIGGTANVTANGSGASTLFGTRTVAAVDGRATFTNLAAEGAGNFALTFVSNGATNAFSNDFTVAPAPPGIRLLVGGGPVRDAMPNQSFGVPIELDLSNRGGADLAALDVTVSWDPARFEYFDRSVGPWRDSSSAEAVITADESQVANSIIRFSGSSSAATIANFRLGMVLLRTLPTTATVESVVNAVVNSAANAAAAAVSVTVLPMKITVYAP